MKVLKEFHPLYTEDFFIADLWGGRGGARSYHLIQHALYQLLYNDNFRGFFLREVHSSIYSSMWQDLKDRLQEAQEQGHDLSHIQISDNRHGENYAINTKTNASVFTKGFKVGSGNQTANLKSLAGATHVYIDEADETSKSQFDKLRQSLRKIGVKIQIIRAFNPPPKEHWLWGDYDFIPLTEEDIIARIMKLSNDSEENIRQLIASHRPIDNVFLDAKVKDGSYKHITINTNYGNNIIHINEDAINGYEQDKYKDFHLYCNTILGLVTSGTERAVYKGWEKITFEQFDNADGNLLYYLDFGDIVPNAFGLLKMDGEYLYIREVITKPDRELPILEAMEKANINKTIPIIADSANRNQIASIRKAGYNIMAVNKSHDANVSAIKEIRKLKVFVAGDTIWSEYLGYKYGENKTGELLHDEVPIKGNDHHMDGIKYGWIGRRMAMSNFKVSHNLVV